MNETKQAQLDEVAAQIVDDKVCPELAAGATQLVFGDGNPDAELVFIGEAPGKREDEQGLPFVGAAGQFLNELLAGIGLNRQDVYITNIVKYRPPDNRDPFPDEKIAFLPYLHQQLAVIQPKIVITLGRHSLECFLPGLKISACHGQPKRIKVRVKSGEGRPEKDSLSTVLVILPLFHPAAALYNGGMRQTIVDDFAKIPAILEQIDSPASAAAQPAAAVIDEVAPAAAQPVTPEALRLDL